jgi:hypothetical protein
LTSLADLVAWPLGRSTASIMRTKPRPTRTVRRTSRNPASTPNLGFAFWKAVTPRLLTARDSSHTHSPGRGGSMRSGKLSDVATCMDDAGLSPFTVEGLDPARNLQRVRILLFKSENASGVREALPRAGESERIQSGCDSLIPAHPPRTCAPRSLGAGARGTHRGWDCPYGAVARRAAPAAHLPAPRPSAAGYRKPHKTFKRRPR